MKNVTFLLMLSTILIASCDYEELITPTKELQLEIEIASSVENPLADFPDNITMDLSLTSSNLDSELKGIVFTRKGDFYTSDTVALPAGDYDIREFSVHDEEIQSVEQLFESFRVDQNARLVKIGNVAARATHGKPLLIAVYVEHNGKKQLTEATATIIGDEGSQSFQLSARTNPIVFSGDRNMRYKLMIEKEGYEPWSVYFVYNQLKKKRLEITLSESTSEPEPVITFTPGNTAFNIELQLMSAGTVILDWSNGSMDTVDFAVDPNDLPGTAFYAFEMNYPKEILPARIIGDVHLIKGLYMDAEVRAIDARAATGLRIVTLDGGDIDTLDFSMNQQLYSLSMVFMTSINEMILPQQHEITNLLIFKRSEGDFPSEIQLDYIIGNVYDNAVTRNITSGFMDISYVPVSAQSTSKLMELQDYYQWEIVITE